MDDETSVLHIIILGGGKSGKSFIGNCILTKDVNIPVKRFPVGNNTSTQCLLGYGIMINQQPVCVIDTPNDFKEVETRNEIVKLMNGMNLNAETTPLPVLFLLVISTSRNDGNLHERLELYLKVFGSCMVDQTLVIFNEVESDWDKNTETEKIESFKELITKLPDKCHPFAKCKAILFKKFKLIDETTNKELPEKKDVGPLAEKLTSMKPTHPYTYLINHKGLF